MKYMDATSHIISCSLHIGHGELVIFLPDIMSQKPVPNIIVQVAGT